MPKLETQINQIYLVRPEAKKTSLILYEERLREPLHLFVLFELTGIKKKTEINELKKVSETILDAFRQNQKLPLNSLFETTLSLINQNLGEIAHKGTKSWLGKLSAVLALKTENEIFLANTGSASVWLKRKNELSEILPAEKKGDHPLKIFQNFSSGKVKERDSLLITSNNLFNYVSLPLLTKLLAQNNVAEACDEISKVLQESSNDNNFAAFFLEIVPASEVQKIESNPVAEPKPVYNQPIYAPLPEDIAEPVPKSSFSLSKFKNPFSLIKVPALSVPSIKLPGKFNELSGPRKFFLISFAIFMIVLIANVFVWGSKAHSRKIAQQIEVQTDAVAQALAEAESALLYRNEDQAMRLLEQAQTEISKLKDLNGQVTNLEAKYKQLYDRINRITVINNPKVIAEVKHSPVFLTGAGNSLLLAGNDSNSLGIFSNSFRSLLLLNALNGEITGIAHIPNSGNWLTTPNGIYKVDEINDEFKTILSQNNRDLFRIKYLPTNRIYVADKKSNQILRMQTSGDTVSGMQNVLRENVNLDDLQDFGLDADVYLLFRDQIKRYVSGREQSFRIPRLNEQMSDAKRIIVGNNLYILEPSKKRVLMISKSGTLVNQIYFPNANQLSDFYVHETERRMNLIDGNNLVEITF